MSIEERLTDIETVLAYQQKMIDDLNEVIIYQGKKIDALDKENKLLINMMKEDGVKPLSEETPPPHY